MTAAAKRATNEKVCGSQGAETQASQLTPLTVYYVSCIIRELRQNMTDVNHAKNDAIVSAVHMERNRCADAILLNASELRLMAGELTQAEVQLIQAVLRGISARIRRG